MSETLKKSKTEEYQESGNSCVTNCCPKTKTNLEPYITIAKH